MSELKACPFCGVVLSVSATGVNGHPANGCIVGKIGLSHEDVSKWNIRPIEDGLRAELARRDEIIARLKEDAERLAVEQNYFCCQKHEAYMCHFEETDAHNPDCPITLHRALMKELE